MLPKQQITIAAIIVVMIFIVATIIRNDSGDKQINDTVSSDDSPVDEEPDDDIDAMNENYLDEFAPDIEGMMNLEGMKKNAPAFSFTDDSVFKHDEENFHLRSDNSVEKYMNKQLMVEPGKKFRISTGYNQLGAVKPLNSLGEAFKMSSISTVF